MSIEVEQHFTIGPQTRPKLIALGAEQTSRLEFTDTYFDRADHQLMKADHWLRKRNGTWQLKHPVLKLHESDSGSHEGHWRTACYHELEEDSAIITQLCNIIEVGEEMESLNRLVVGGTLLPVAEFSTVREGWVWPDGRMGDRVSIELDEASFNYTIGSVEVMVGTAEEVPGAETIARDIARKIGNNNKQYQLVNEIFSGYRHRCRGRNSTTGKQTNHIHSPE